MKIDQALCNGETEAIASVIVCPYRVHAKESFEYLFLVSERYADACVPDDKTALRIVEPRLDPYTTSLWGISDCIIDQDHQDPFDHCLVSAQWHDLGLGIAFHRDLTRA